MKSFRLYPERMSPLYVEVRIYRSRRLMLAALKRFDKWLGVRGDWSNARAVCRSCWTQKRVDKKWVTLPRVSVVFFTAKSLGSGIVSHEIAHATIQWARRVKLSGPAVWGCGGIRKRDTARMESAANERFAWVLGSLNCQFWQHWYAR